MHSIHPLALFIPLLSFFTLCTPSPLLSPPPPPTLHLTDPNTTNPPPLTSVPWPVPFTPITLEFLVSGDPIPPPDLTGALTTAIRQVAPAVRDARRRTDPLPPDGWSYLNAPQDIGFCVVSDTWHGGRGVVTWQILSWTLRGLLLFVERDAGRRLAAREWDFAILMAGRSERVGTGSIAAF